MLVNIVLVIFVLIGLGIMIFFLSCMYRQYKGVKNTGYIELFPEEDMYVKNSYEDEKFEMSKTEKEDSEKWAKTQRGSVRIACGVYFTSDEYKKYRESVIKTRLP